MDTQPNNALHYAECCAECRVLFTVMLSATMLKVDMLSVVMLNVVMLSVVMLCVSFPPYSTVSEHTIERS